MSKLGMLGAISGLGQGLQDYSKVMQENRKMEWEDKKAQVNYERQEHLQKLRDKQARLLQQDDHAFQSDLYGQKLEDTRKAQRDQNTWSEDRDKAKHNQAIDLLKEKNRLLQENREADAVFNTEQRQAEWNQLVEQGVLEGRSEKEVETLKLSVLHPEVYKTIAAANKLNEFPVAEYQKQYDKSLAAFPQLDKNEQKVYQDMAVNAGLDPLEAPSLYATRQAMISTRQVNLAEEGQLNLGRNRKVALEEKREDLEKKRFKEAKANKSKLTVEDAELFTDPGRRAQVLEWAKKNEKRKNELPPPYNPTTASPATRRPDIERRVMGALQNY